MVDSFNFVTKFTIKSYFSPSQQHKKYSKKLSFKQLDLTAVPHCSPVFWLRIAQTCVLVLSSQFNYLNNVSVITTSLHPNSRLQLCYGIVLVMLLFYSSVTNQATTYKSDENKRIFSLCSMDHISYVFFTLSLL